MSRLSVLLEDLKESWQIGHSKVIDRFEDRDGYIVESIQEARGPKIPEDQAVYEKMFIRDAKKAMKTFKDMAMKIKQAGVIQSIPHSVDKFELTERPYEGKKHFARMHVGFERPELTKEGAIHLGQRFGDIFKSLKFRLNRQEDQAWKKVGPFDVKATYMHSSIGPSLSFSISYMVRSPEELNAFDRLVRTKGENNIKTIFR